MGSLFDKAMLGAAAFLASAVLHGVALALLIFTSTPRPRDAIVFEIFTPSAVDEGPVPLAQPPGASAVPAVVTPTPPASSTTGQRRGYRQVLREKEELFQIAMTARRARLAALERHRPGEAAPAPDDTEVRLCGARAVGAAIQVTSERAMDRYAALAPTGLFPSAYTSGMTQVLARSARPARVGRLEFALPPRAAVVQLDDPAETLFSVGRSDARCLVGVSWNDEEIFPIRFSRLPARWVADDDRVHEVQIEVLLHVDGTFTVEVQEGEPLPFEVGTLYDQKTVARNLAQHATGARVMRDMFKGLFGG